MNNIDEVAKRAGVAKSTVSNVFTGKKFVRQELKDKILAICADIDYQPNFYASRLTNKKTNIIALILEPSKLDKYPFYKDLIVSCILEASKKGYSLLVYYALSQNEMMNVLKRDRAPIDGAILMAPCVDDARLKYMQSNRICCTVIGKTSIEDMNFIDIDNVELVSKVATNLINSYGKDIYLLNSASNMIISKDRKQGFIDACNREGIDVSDRIAEFDAAENDKITEFVKDKIKKGAGFITSNSQMAKIIYTTADEKSLKIGEDIAVFSLGIPDNDFEFNPSLSYAYQNYNVLGETAVNILVDEITKGEKAQKFIESEIFWQNSTKD